MVKRLMAERAARAADLRGAHAALAQHLRHHDAGECGGPAGLGRACWELRAVIRQAIGALAPYSDVPVLT